MTWHEWRIFKRHQRRVGADVAIVKSKGKVRVVHAVTGAWWHKGSKNISFCGLLQVGPRVWIPPGTGKFITQREARQIPLCRACRKMIKAGKAYEGSWPSWYLDKSEVDDAFQIGPPAPLHVREAPEDRQTVVEETWEQGSTETEALA